MLLGARLFTNMSPIYDPKWINIPYMEHMIWDSFKYVNIIYIYVPNCPNIIVIFHRYRQI